MEFYQINECHTVVKPWGHEVWLQAGTEVYPFALKELLLKAGNQTSLQVHQFKSESIRVISGSGQILYSDQLFDCTRFFNNGYSELEIDALKKNLKVKQVSSGLVFHTPPGTIHRMVADIDLVYIEASTTQLDDVIRLEDSSNRSHGRIDAEHV